MTPDVPALRRHLNLPAPGWVAVSRGAALGLSCLLTMNLMEVFVYGTSAVDNWFVNLNPLSQPLAITLLTMASLALLMFSGKPSLPGPVQWITLALTVLFAGFCGRELWEISSETPEAEKATAMALPLGTIVLFAVASPGVLLGNAESVRGRSSLLAIFISATLTVAGFVIVLMQSSALMDPLPENTVPVTLLLIGDPSANGMSSDAIADRVNTAAQMLKQGHSRTVVLFASGSADPESSTEGLQALLSEAGVSDPVVLSHDVPDDLQTVLSMVAQQKELATDRRIIVVTHWYELARVRLLAKRSGLLITAVPAQQQHALFDQNRLVLREAGKLLSSLVTPTVVFLRNSLKPAAAMLTTSSDAVN